MIWPLSHSEDGLHNAQLNIQSRSREWLEEVAAEWAVYEKVDNTEDFEVFQELMDEELLRLKEVPQEALADFVFDKAVEQGDCTNGGWELYCCPYHCAPHTVGFDLEEDASDEN